MKQILQILAKDARHLWIEILISIALNFALVVVYPNTMSFSLGASDVGLTSYSPAGAASHFLGGSLVLLLPFAWLLLITRIVHAERLVGDRQYWLTRPYEWKKLLAAKALFLVVFLYLPLLVTQCLLLFRAGFNPAPHLPALLLSALWMTNALILPVIAIATVTTNLVRVVLIALGSLLYFIVISVLAGTMPAGHIDRPYSFFISSIFVFSVCVSVVFVQYAARKTSLSWTLLLALLASIAAVSFAAPDQAMVSHDYPTLAANDVSPVHFSYSTDPVHQPTAYLATRSSQVGIALPILESGVPERSIVIPGNLRATINAPDGTHWRSRWMPLSPNFFYLGETTFLARFDVPRSLYDKLRSTPLSLQIDVSFEQAHQAAITHAAVPSRGDFTIPDFGVCKSLTDDALDPGEVSGIACRAPIHQPPFTYIQTTWSYGPCSQSGQSVSGVQGATWLGSLHVEPASFGIVPVWTSFVPFSNRFPSDDPRGFRPRHLCQGAPVTFTRYDFTRRTQTSLSIQNFQLPTLTSGQERAVEHP